jgi:hypothetical protein
MTAAPALPLPGSRTLLGWWRDLASLSPQRLWLSHLLLHRVEALAVLARPRRLDPFQRAVLQAVAVEPPAHTNHVPHPPPGGLLERLELGPGVLPRLLRELAAAGLLHAAGPRWELTPTGHDALSAGAALTHSEERRVFYFLDNAELGRPPEFLPLHRPPTSPLPAGEGWRFDLADLEACVRRPPEWKARRRFPADVEAVQGPQSEDDWRGVALDRAEQLPVAFVQVPPAADGTCLLGLAVRTDVWVVERDPPALALGPGWEEALPDLAAAPPAEAWRQAWLAWCQPRNVPAAEAAACRLEQHGPRLLVRAPRRVLDHLRAVRSDAVRGETFLLAGAGRTHHAAQVELAPLE